MPLTPLRFAAVHQLKNPTNQQLNGFDDQLDKLVWSSNRQQVTVLTDDDADTAHEAYDYFESYPDAALAPKDRSLEVRKTQKWLKLTGAQSPKALDDWYLTTPKALIETTHQQFQKWVQRFETKVFGAIDALEFDPESVKKSLQLAQIQEAGIKRLADNLAWLTQLSDPDAEVPQSSQKEVDKLLAKMRRQDGPKNPPAKH